LTKDSENGVQRQMSLSNLHPNPPGRLWGEGQRQVLHIDESQRRAHM
jgi:hypothetical protein